MEKEKEEKWRKRSEEWEGVGEDGKEDKEEERGRGRMTDKGGGRDIAVRTNRNMGNTSCTLVYIGTS